VPAKIAHISHIASSTSWVANSRPVGCPQMTWGRTLVNALASKGISKEFKEWIAIAKDRPLRNEGTQLSQTCSEGCTYSATALYRGVSLFWGSIN